MKGREYLSLALFLGLLGCLVYSWIWWHGTGRHHPAQRRFWGRLALIYATVLPLLFIGLLPRCNVPASYATSGIPFAAIGVLAALFLQGQGRALLVANAAGWYVAFTLSLPLAPAPC